MTSPAQQLVSPLSFLGYVNPWPAEAHATRKHVPTANPSAALRERLADDIRSVANGDLDAFKRVYQTTSSKLFGVILRVVGRQDVAEEILQDVYVILWTRAVQFDQSKASPITWLAAIARNRAIDAIRRKQPAFIEDTPGAFDLPSQEDVAAAYEELESERRIFNSLSKLTPARRRLLEQVYFDGKSRVNLAAEFGCPVNKIRIELKSALAELKRHLDASEGRDATAIK